MLFALLFAALMPGPVHAGFDKLVVKGKVTVPCDYFHYLHHRYFECNYGTATVPLDRWFGTLHDGTPESYEKMRGKKRFKQNMLHLPLLLKRDLCKSLQGAQIQVELCN